MKRWLWILCIAPLGLACRESGGTSTKWFVAGASADVSRVVVEHRATHGIEVVRDRESGKPIALVVRPHGAGRTTAGTTWLATNGDAVLRLRDGRVTLVSPALPARTWSAPAARIVEMPDPATLVRIEVQRERLHVSAWGDLVLHEKPGGLTVHLPGTAPVELEAGSQVRAAGRAFLITAPAGNSELVSPPKPRPAETQIAFVPQRESVRFFDPWGDVSAELPSNSIEVRAGQQGFLLTGEFTSGLAGVADGPFDVFLPLRNHHLLVLLGD